MRIHGEIFDLKSTDAQRLFFILAAQLISRAGAYWRCAWSHFTPYSSIIFLSMCAHFVEEKVQAREYARDWSCTVLHGRRRVVAKFAILKLPLLNAHFLFSGGFIFPERAPTQAEFWSHFTPYIPLSPLSMWPH